MEQFTIQQQPNSNRPIYIYNMSILRGGFINVRTALVTKSWADIGFDNPALITRVNLINPPLQNVPSYTPGIPSAITGIEKGKSYLIRPAADINDTTNFFDYTAPLPPASTTLIGNQINVRTAVKSLTWAELGFNSETIKRVYLIDPPTNATQSWTPNVPGPLTGIVAGKNYLISPKMDLIMPDGFFVEIPADALPITSVMLTSFDEFGYDTIPIVGATEYGAGKVLNGVLEQIKQGKNVVKTDFIHMLDEDAAKLPALNEMIAWANWFTVGNNTNFGMNNPTQIRPMLQQSTYEQIVDGTWQVAQYTMNGGTAAPRIPKALKGSGTMNDASFVRGMLKLAERGYSVGIVPVVITCNLEGNAANYQNWRGYIKFNNTNDYNLFAADYEAMIKHYIDLCYNNSIPLSTIYVGSEFEALIKADYEAADDIPYNNASNFHGTTTQGFRDSIKASFMQLLGDLGLYAKTKYPAAQITYAANWTEYNKADALWGHAGIDAVGIDWYFPLSEQHTNEPDVLGQGVLTGEHYDYVYSTYDQNQTRLSLSSKVGRLLDTKAPIANPSYLNALKAIQSYKSHLATLGINKPFIATELGVASCQGSSVLPNVFPVLDAVVGTDPTGNITSNATQMPDSHNLKSFFLKLSEFNLQIKDVIGPYGSTFEMDETHQYNGIAAIIQVMESIGITRHVIYTLDARPSAMMGAVVFNTDNGVNRDEIYTYDTPTYPLSHAINGKKAGGWPEGSLLGRITPTAGNSEQIPTSSETISYRSFVNTNLYDYEWGANGDDGNGGGFRGYKAANASTPVLNHDKQAGTVGRFCYFKTMGVLDEANPVNNVRVPARINFEAMTDDIGGGTIEVIIFGQNSDNPPQAGSEIGAMTARRTFKLTNQYQTFGWTLSPMYPQQEYVIGVFFNGMNTSGNVTARFRKNFCLILDQANMGDSFYRLRADTTTLVGNVETSWYGWSDKSAEYAVQGGGAGTTQQIAAIANRKKYVQASAYSRFKIETEATNLAVEYVRDFYNSDPKNIFPMIYIDNGKELDPTASGGLKIGNGAACNRINVVAGQEYIISGLRTGLNNGSGPSLIWLNSSGAAIGGIVNPTNIGTNSVPVYSVTPPAGAVRMALQLQKIFNTNNWKDPINDSFTAYQNCVIEKGPINTNSQLGDLVPSRTVLSYLGTERLKESGFSVFIDDVFWQYFNVEDDPTQTYAKQVQIKEFTLPPLPSGVTSRKIEIVTSGRGTYLPESPIIRRAGTYLRALYISTANSNVSIDSTPIV